MSARDEPGPKPTVIGGRAARAFRNYMENFPAFAALDLAFLATNHPPGSGRRSWIAARIVYVPLYLAGVLMSAARLGHLPPRAGRDAGQAGAGLNATPLFARAPGRQLTLKKVECHEL